LVGPWLVEGLAAVVAVGGVGECAVEELAAAGVDEVP
jgi:hypothetical protein